MYCCFVSKILQRGGFRIAESDEKLSSLLRNTARAIAEKKKTRAVRRHLLRMESTDEPPQIAPHLAAEDVSYLARDPAAAL